MFTKADKPTFGGLMTAEREREEARERVRRVRDGDRYRMPPEPLADWERELLGSEGPPPMSFRTERGPDGETRIVPERGGNPFERIPGCDCPACSSMRAPRPGAPRPGNGPCSECEKHKAELAKVNKQRDEFDAEANNLAKEYAAALDMIAELREQVEWANDEVFKAWEREEALSAAA